MASIFGIILRGRVTPYHLALLKLVIPIRLLGNNHVRHSGCSIGSLILVALILVGGCSDKEELVAVDKPATMAAKQKSEAPPKKPALPPVTSEEMLQYALDGNLPKIVLALERETDVNRADQDGRTPLMLASFNGHFRIVDVLLKKGAKVDARDAEGRTALMFAATIEQPESVRLLLEAGSEINLVDSVEGFSPLMFAAAEGHIQVVEELLKSGAKLDIVDQDGDTALSFAKRNGRTAVVERLVEAATADGL
jgi:uncharacterized protein